MYKIEVSAGQVVAKDTQNSIEMVDNAVMSVAALCTSIVEVSRASSMPASAPQGILTDVGNGLIQLISSRAEISRATRRMRAIQAQSTLCETSFGCPDGLPDISGAIGDEMQEASLA